MTSIYSEIVNGKKPQGYELTILDLGRSLSLDFGQVLPCDVGKKVWARKYGLVMENKEQRDARKMRGEE